MGPMFENQRAFAPFYDTAVAVEAAREGGRVIRTTVRACVLDMGLDEPFSDGGTDSRRRAYSVSVMVAECERSGWRPQIGDVLTFDDGRKTRGQERVAAGRRRVRDGGARMIQPSVSMSYQGRPISVLRQLIAERQKVLGESVRFML